MNANWKTVRAFISSTFRDMQAEAIAAGRAVLDGEALIGDPTEGALIVLGGKGQLDIDETRTTYPRVAEVPFDSEYKFMATFHDRPDWMSEGVLHEPHFMTIKGAPDVVIGSARLAASRRPARSPATPT